MRRLLGVLLVLLLAVPLYAGETGSISGVVKDSQGGVLPGASVRVSGEFLPAGREVTTSGTGSFQFLRLLPGVYRVEATITGMGKAIREVRVSVDVDAQLDLLLSPTLEEEVTVVAETPVVDMRSTEVNVNFTSDTIGSLPLQRSYQGLFQLVPGVADNRSDVGPSAGGSRQDNTYLVDGVNVTNPSFGYLATEINELDIAEFNVKRGAISAEFGRSAGMVTNAVSRSGTNQITGVARFEFMPEAFIGEPKDPAFQDSQLSTVMNPALGVGGPLIKDKVFWYASARYSEAKRYDRENRAGEALPDEVEKRQEFHGKLTATPGDQHLLAASFRYQPADVENDSLSTADAASVSETTEIANKVATASWSFFPTDRTLLEVKYLYMKNDIQSAPDTELGYLPTFDINNITRMGEYFDSSRNLWVGGSEFTNTTNYTRWELRAVASQFLDIGSTSHQIKAGVGYEFGEEEMLRRANGWGAITAVTRSGVPAYRARYYHEQPPQLGQGRTWSIFAQDTVTIGQRVSAYAGVLVNRDEYAQDLTGSGGCPEPTLGRGGAAIHESDGDRCTFIRFDFADQVQPRVGLNVNVRQGKGDKVYVNWGRYYNLDQKSSGRSLAPRRIFQREAYYNRATGELMSDGPRASTTGKLIDPDLKPTYNDEWLAGYATPIVGDWSADLYFQYRTTKNFIEDVPSRYPWFGPYAAANLPCSRFESCQNADAERKYRAFTVELNKRMADRWSLIASYTWSQFEGNFDLDYSGGAVFNTSSYIQDGPGTFVEEPNRYGPLSQDRPHVFKLFGNFVPVDGLTLGGYFRVQSGTPWQARGSDSQGSAYLNYLEAAGSRRNPTWANFDLLASYRFDLSEDVKLTVEGRVLNVLNTQTQTSADERQYLDYNDQDDPPYILPYEEPNPLFATADAYAPQRRFLLTMLLNF